MKIRLICPRCGNQDIAVKVIFQQEKPKEMDMDEWAVEEHNTFRAIPSVYYCTQEIATCGKCGYQVKRMR